MYYESTYLYSTSFTHKTPLALFSLCLYTFIATPITTDPFLQAIIISNALVFIVIISSLFCGVATLAPINCGGYKLNESMIHHKVGRWLAIVWFINQSVCHAPYTDVNREIDDGDS